jgi:hypothetical protein
MVYAVGHDKIEHKYKKKLKQLKLSNQPMASVSFCLHSEDDQATHHHSQELANAINKLAEEAAKEPEQDADSKRQKTSIPFFHSMNDWDEKVPIPSLTCKEFPIGLTVGTLVSPSDILTPDHF